MDQKGISIILFYSVCGIGAYIPLRYHFVNEDKTWSEAQTYCREKYTDLTNINNMEEMMKLKNISEMKTAEKVWIGLKSNGTGKWQWSLADQTFYRDGDTYRNWASGEPNNNGGNEYCGDIAKDGKWFDSTCQTPLPFVCYEVNNEYKFINETKTWYDAQTYCRKNHTDLVSVRNQTENEEIRNLIKNTQPEGVWIGLFYDSWKWSDQSNSLFIYNISDQLKNSENKMCAAVKMDQGKLNCSEENCTREIPFICHENKLVLIKQNLTWKEALRYCRNHHDDLVSVRTEEMQLWVKEATQGASTEQVWLGLRHTCVLGFWYWVTGEMLCYQDWAPGNGTGFEDCSSEERTGAVQSGGQKQWVSLPESHKLNFICSNYDD